MDAAAAIDPPPGGGVVGALLVGSAQYTGAARFFRVVKYTAKRVMVEELESESVESYSDTPIHHVFKERVRYPLKVIERKRPMTISNTAKRGWMMQHRTKDCSDLDRVYDFRPYEIGTVVQYSFSHD